MLTIREAFFTKLWMLQFHNTVPLHLVKILPQEDQEAISKAEVHRSSFSPLLHWKYNLLCSIHFSWLVTPLSYFSKEEQNFICHSLPIENPDALARQCSLPFSPHLSLSPFCKKFYLERFLEKWALENVLPLPLLPDHPLHFLLQLSRESLLDYFNLLGIYDLADSLRLILDQKTIRFVYLRIDH